MLVNRRIKVLECIRQGQIGGGESHLLSLVQNLDKKFFDPVVLSFSDGPMISQLQDEGVRTHVICTNRPFDLTKWIQIRKWIRSGGFDLVHAHGTRANSNILWAAKSLRLPVVYSIHGWSFHLDQHPFIREARVWGEALLVRNSTVNISVSESNKATGKQYFKGFNSIVVNNGIDQRKFNTDCELKCFRQEVNIPKDALLILFIARFTHQKQPLVLIKAFEKVAEMMPDAVLLMVGDGEQKNEAVAIVDNSRFKNRIVLLPFRKDVPDILNAADVFVLPSLWEGLPIGLLEAMAMGKAVIATEVDGSKELICHKKNGYLIDVESLENNLMNALVEIGSNSGLRREMQNKARQTVKEHYDAANMTRQIEKIYQQVIANSI